MFGNMFNLDDFFDTDRRSREEKRTDKFKSAVFCLFVAIVYLGAIFTIVELVRNLIFPA